MRQLEVVAISDDGTQVLLASAEDAVRATHSVRIDNRLQAAIRGELDDSERRESELSPKEIQARLRAGESEEQIAKLARVPVARVVRYAGPVISERELIVEQARGAVLQRARGPEATTPLGQLVEKRLGAIIGIRFETVTWTARRRDDGAWIVALSYVGHGGARTASWLWQPADRGLTSLNGLATRLGAEDLPAAGRRKRVLAKPAAKRSAAQRTATKRTAAKRATPKRSSTQTSGGSAAKRSATKASAAKATAAKATATKRAPASRGTAKRTVGVATVSTRGSAAKRSAAKPTRRATTAKPAAKPVSRRTPRRAAAVAPSTKRRRAPRVVEAPVIEPAARRSNGRVAVPSWSDVLLGVQAPAASRGRRRS